MDATLAPRNPLLRHAMLQGTLRADPPDGAAALVSLSHVAFRYRTYFSGRGLSGHCCSALVVRRAHGLRRPQAD
jgi:hypothetical protein